MCSYSTVVLAQMPHLKTSDACTDNTSTSLLVSGKLTMKKTLVCLKNFEFTGQAETMKVV